MKELEENAHLKKMFAELSLVHHALKDTVEKVVGPGEKKALVELMIEEHGVSVCQACKAVGVARGTYEYKPVDQGVSLIVQELQLLVDG